MTFPISQTRLLLVFCTIGALNSCNLYDDVCKQNSHLALKKVMATSPLGEQWNTGTKPPSSIQGSSVRYNHAVEAHMDELGPRSKKVSFSFGIANERLGLKPDPNLAQDEVKVTPAKEILFKNVHQTWLPALAPKQISEEPLWQVVSSVLSTGKTIKKGSLGISRGDIGITPGDEQDFGNEFIGVKLGTFKNVGAIEQVTLDRGAEAKCEAAGIHLRYAKEIRGTNENERSRALTDIIPFAGEHPAHWRNSSSQPTTETYNRAWFMHDPMQPAPGGFMQRVRIASGEVALILVRSKADQDVWVQVRLLDFSGPDGDDAAQTTYQVQRVVYQR